MPIKMLRRIALTIIIAVLAYSQYRVTSWKQEQQLLHFDEVHSWRIALRRYGLDETYRSNHRYSAEDILRENGLSRGNHKRSAFRQLRQNMLINIDSPHPNLYYTSLRLFLWRGIDNAKQFIERGMLLNLLFYIILLLYLYRLYQLIFGPSFIGGVLVLIIYSLTMGHLANLYYIRMYYLAAMSLVILSYYVLRTIKEQSFSLQTDPSQESKQKNKQHKNSCKIRICAHLKTEKIAHRLQELAQKNRPLPFSPLGCLLHRLYQASKWSQLRRYRIRCYVVLVLTLYLNYSSHYFAILAVALWGLILIFHYCKDYKTLLTYIEILFVSIVLMATTQGYFLFNLVTASHTDRVLEGMQGKFENAYLSLQAYWNFINQFFIPRYLLYALSLFLLATGLIWLWNKRHSVAPKQAIRQYLYHFYLPLFTLTLPLLALLFSPFGKQWRIIAPYTPLFVLFLPYAFCLIRYKWLQNALLAAVLGFYAWVYPQQRAELHTFLNPPFNAPANIESIQIINHRRPHPGEWSYKLNYYYPSVLRLLTGNQQRYLRDDTSYQYIETVEEAEPNNMPKEGYILLDPYMVEGGDLEYLQQKGIEFLQEYAMSLYRYRIR